MNETQFDAYVRRRLDDWGREFAFHRQAVRLGMPRQNYLQSVIDFRGRVPVVTGFKPQEIDVMAMQIEDIIHDIHAHNRLVACVMRGYYCGLGRVGWERREQAGELYGAAIPRNRYFDAHKQGICHAADALMREAVAA